MGVDSTGTRLGSGCVPACALIFWYEFAINKPEFLIRFTRMICGPADSSNFQDAVAMVRTLRTAVADAHEAIFN